MYVFVNVTSRRRTCECACVAADLSEGRRKVCETRLVRDEGVLRVSRMLQDLYDRDFEVIARL